MRVAFGFAVLAGAAIALSLPPFGWWPLGVGGLAVFAGLLMGPAGTSPTPTRARAVLGMGVGLGQYAIGLWWVTEFNAAGFVALVIHGAACTALAGALVPARRRFGVVLGLPAALVVADWIRDNVPFGGLPIGGTALGQASGPLAVSVRLGGSLLLTGAAAATGAGLATLVAAARHPRRPRRPLHAGDSDRDRDRVRLLGGLVALALVAVVVVAARLSPDGSGPGPHTPLRVAVVQGGGPRGLRATSSDPAAVLQRQFDASTSLTPPLDLVLWPEDVVHVDGPVDQTPEAAVVGALAARLHATVVAGVVEEDIAPGRFRNAAVAWSPQGTMVARYDKVHRVPFGEYIPGRSLLRHFVDLGLVSADAIAGHGPGRLVTPAGPLGAVISYEVFYDDRARAAIHAGGQVLLVPSNTSSYRTSQVPTQAVAAARLQALETGRTALYVSPTGYGAIVGPDGRVVARTTLGRAQVLLGSVAPRTGETVYVRFGDRPLLVLLLAGLAVARWPRRRRS